MWNVTAIAASGHPRALELVQDILLASASIPVGFPPVMIDVEVDGRRYQEMHVDGGTSNQVFFYPPAVKISRGRVGSSANAASTWSGTPAWIRSGRT